jgi:hypothetical protein
VFFAILPVLLLLKKPSKQSGNVPVH